MLAVSSSCLSSDDHVILSSADKPFALSPLFFPPHWTRGRGCKKNTHKTTHFCSAKRVGRFPRWYGLPLSPLLLLLSYITHTYLTITPLAADSVALTCWLASLTANIRYTEDTLLSSSILCCITLQIYLSRLSDEDPDVDPLQILLKTGLKTLQAQAWIYTGFQAFYLITEIGQIFRDAVKPRYNEGSRVDSQYVFVISRFCCIEVLFQIF